MENRDQTIASLRKKIAEQDAEITVKLSEKFRRLFSCLLHLEIT